MIGKNQDSGSVRFYSRWKERENAFLSYPDRIVSYYPGKDSLGAFHFTREYKDNTIQYTPGSGNLN